MFNLINTSRRAFVCFFAILFFSTLFIENKLLAQPQAFNFDVLTTGTSGVYTAGTLNPYSTNAPNYDVFVIDGESFSNLTGKNISILNYASVTITNCYFGASLGAGIEIDGCYNVLIENNFFANNRAGVYARACTNIKVKNNQFINVHSISSSGQFVQFNACYGEGNEVSGNIGENFCGESRPEDLINMFSSSGTLLNPILIENNKFRGGGPSNSGGGILAGDYGGNYITIRYNKLFNPGQYGIGITSGTGHKILYNDVWSDEKPWSNVGLPIWRLPEEGYPACEDVEVSDNRVNFLCGNSDNCPGTEGQPNNYFYPTKVSPPEEAENCTGIRDIPDPLELSDIQPYFPTMIFSINTANPEDKVWHIRDDAWNFYTEMGLSRPIAVAEADKPIFSDITTLSGTGSTSGSSYRWVQVSGPVTVAIANSTFDVCNISGLTTDGVYEFRLEVTKDCASDADWVTVTKTSSPNPATLNGTVILQRGSVVPPSIQWQVPLQVDFYTSGNTTAVGTYNVTTDQSGQFVITGVPLGTYYISVKHSHALKRVKQSQTMVTGNNNLNFGILIEGDANNDNYVNINDYNILQPSYNKFLGEPGYDDRADFNEDNVVDLLDFGQMMGNFDQLGEILNFNCTFSSATIEATALCNSQGIQATLTAANGTDPYNLGINGTGYRNVTIGNPINLYTYFTAYPKIWPNNPIPAIPNNIATQPIEVGVKFKSTQAGFITGISFYNGNNNSGTYTVKLYDYASGTLLASANATSVSKNAWKYVYFSNRVFIAANTTYIASRYSSAGNFSRTANYFTNSGVTNGPLTALKNGVSGVNGVYRYGSGMPTTGTQSTNYWVDVITLVSNTATINLTNVTDANGCGISGALQTITVTSAACPPGRFMNTTDTFESIEIIPQINQEISDIKAGDKINKKIVYSLGQNYPNPFNKVTTIQFSLPKAEKVNLSLFDVNGRIVKVLVNGSKDAGTHSASFNAESLSKGVYYYRMQAGDFSDVKKLVIQ